MELISPGLLGTERENPPMLPLLAVKRITIHKRELFFTELVHTHTLNNIFVKKFYFVVVVVLKFTEVTGGLFIPKTVNFF